MKRVLVAAVALVLAVGLLGAGKPPAVVQVDVHEILNARVVATFTNGKVVNLKDDIDGAGGHATTKAAEALKSKDPKALPDDGHFPATDRHPEVVLNYSNDDGEKPQARRVPGEAEFGFAVPAKNYTSMFLFTTSGWGSASKLTVTLTYKDGTTDTRDVEAPDWFWELKKDDKDRCYLAEDLGKWDKNGKMVEARHHFIVGIDVHPDASKVLEKVNVKKSKPGLLVFYGATGVVKE